MTKYDAHRSILIGLWMAGVIFQSQSQDIRLPPSITEGLPQYIVYQNLGTIALLCDAVGTQPLTIIWKKNGAQLTCTSPRVICTDGVPIAVTQAIADDEGYYQCIVSNSYGTTMSNISFIAYTYLDETVINPQTRDQPVNTPFKLECVPVLNSAPAAFYEWYTITSTGDNNPMLFSTETQTSTNIQIDSSTGDLYFATPVLSNSRYYKCGTRIPTKTSYTGYYNVTITGTSANFPETSFLKSMKPSVGLEGQSVVMQCLMGGRPTQVYPSNTWAKVNGNLPTGRASVTNGNTKLTINDLDPADEGNYSCSVGTVVETYILQVEAVPVFKQTEDGPYNMNATDQDTVTISCHAYANPAATVTWFRNSVVLNPNELPAKYELSSDGTELTISDVCKTCSGGASDLATIQCNASNIHGHVFAQGYLNVLERTIITSESSNYPVSNVLVILPCLATSDDSTPISRNWFYQTSTTPIVPDDQIFVDQNGSLHIDMRNDVDGGVSRSGMYRCHVSNGFSDDQRVSNLTACDINCFECSTNGPEFCDPGRCNAGFVYNSTTMLCEACGADCNACNRNGPGLCDPTFCTCGFVLDPTTTSCASCGKNCSVCNRNGPGFCDKCNPGFRLDTETKQCQEIVCNINKIPGCQQCSDPDFGCTRCQQYFGPTECMPRGCGACDDSHGQCNDCTLNGAGYCDPGQCPPGTVFNPATKKCQAQ